MGWPVASVGTRLSEDGAESRVEALDSAELSARDTEFAGLVERQSRLMFRVAYALLRNAHDAEDAVQEAFLKLYRGEAWRRMEDEKAFLARTVWRVALDKRPPKAGTMTDVADIELVAAGESPEASAVDGQERARLRLLIDVLPEELRQVLLLSAVEEMTSREVGAALGIPEGTVRTRLMRAKAELKRRFEAGQRRAR
jgi:RNA polymerase sigma-70 factor (ECF subfamily)